MRAASTIGGRLGRAGHDRHARLGHDLASPRLRTHRFDRLRRRADEDDSGLGTGTSEIGVLSKEAVAGVDRFGTGLLGGVDDLEDVQVALGRHRGADQEGLVGLAHVRRVAVDLRVDGDRADTHLLERAGDADRDLAPVGYQHLLEHGGAVYSELGGVTGMPLAKGVGVTGMPPGLTNRALMSARF